MMSTAESLFKTCKYIERHFKTQPAVIEDSSKRVLVVGDIHGDFDAMQHVKNMKSEYDRVVFVGDFVDRGNQDIDIVDALPRYLDDVILVGNHDADKNVSPRDFGAHLFMAFGPNGRFIEEAYAQAFTSAPIAYHNTFHKLLVLHGGIPLPLNKYGNFKKWNKFNGSRSDAAFQVLWNDFSYFDVTRQSKRGVGYEVGDSDVLAFMKKNNLNTIVRGHDSRSFNTIYELGKGKSIVTVGSSCRYRTRAVYDVTNKELIRF